MLKNTLQQWGSVSKAFHWTIAAMIVLEVPAGYLMSYTYGLAYKDKSIAPLATLFSQIHHTNGLLILGLAALRLAWLLAGARPRKLDTRWRHQAAAASGVHGALYALLFLLPLSGWAALSVYRGAPIWFFNQSRLIPWLAPQTPPQSTFGYGFFAKIHVWGVWAGGALLSLHILAALWSHVVTRSDVLVRMWPLGRAENRAESKGASP